jgi:hypothetical protein
MTWAIYTAPQDAAVIESGFQQAGLTGGEWNRIRDYAEAWVAGRANAPVIPPEHPCWETDGGTEPRLDGEAPLPPLPGQPAPPDTRTDQRMRVIVMSHGTKAGWLAEMQRLLNRGQKDREMLRFFHDFISTVPWYAVDPYPPPVGFFDGMECV